MEKQRKTELRRSKRISINATASLDWSKLPDDVTAKILSLTPDLPLLEILLKWLKYQRVCKTWQRVFRDRCPPMRWRTIDFKMWDAVPFSDLENLDVDKIYRSAINRSCGQLVDITLGCDNISKISLRSLYEIAEELRNNPPCTMSTVEDNEAYEYNFEDEIAEYVNDIITDELLDYMTERCKGIRRLCLMRCEKITDEGLRAAASRLPQLEDLEISGYFSPETMQVIGRSCPLLKSFRFIKPGLGKALDDDDRTIAIARTMCGLHHLEIGNFELTNNAVKELVDGCPHLETLDLEQVQLLDGWCCFLDKNLRKRIAEQLCDYS